MRTLPSLVPMLARMGVALPAVALGARVLESTFGRPTCLGRYCVGRGSGGYYELLFAVLALGAIAATRTAFAGPNRPAGVVGLVLAAIAFLAPPFALELPALRTLWP